MTITEYIKACLRRDFGDHALNIIPLFDQKLENIRNRNASENESDQDILDEHNQTIYLACADAMKTAGALYPDAMEYVYKIQRVRLMECKKTFAEHISLMIEDGKNDKEKLKHAFKEVVDAVSSLKYVKASTVEEVDRAVCNYLDNNPKDIDMLIFYVDEIQRSFNLFDDMNNDYFDEESALRRVLDAGAEDTLLEYLKQKTLENPIAYFMREEMTRSSIRRIREEQE